MSDIGPGPEENTTPQAEYSTKESAPNANDRETRQWAMFLHFSMLAGWIIPMAGLIVPILIWQMKKDELPGIVPHAHVVLNWIVTSLVYAMICFVLLIVLIGALGFVVLGIVTVIFAIIGGIKANDGELWEYPGTIIKVFK